MSHSSRLYTIPFSHFCEKARWGLDICGIPYHEIKRLPLFHIPTLARVLRKHPTAKADKASSAFSTPAFLSADGRILSDSTDILKFCAETTKGRHLFQTSEVLPVVERLGRILGPHARRLAYYHLLSKPRLTQSMVSQNVGMWQASSFSLLRPLATLALRKTLNINRQSAERSLEKVTKEFDWIASILGQRAFLVSECFTAADLTFAALATPLLLVTHAEGFGGHLPSLDHAPILYRNIAQSFRDHPAGKHALFMYRTQRMHKTSTTSHQTLSI